MSVTLVLAGLAMLVAPDPGDGQVPARPFAASIELTGTIDPATEGWIDEALEAADDDGAELVIVRLDTPGGLDSSMRSIVQAILASPVPVVVYVSPDGARAASAGLFITLAGDVSAMAPQTNIGSATPVSLGGGEVDDVLGRKVRNDAAAYVRALAEGRGHNADLAERMVRDAVNVPARAALDEELIDFVVPTERALLRALEGFEVAGAEPRTLTGTAGLAIDRRDMSLQFELQQLLVNPTVSYLLLLGGLMGIALEVLSPGLIGPGLFGAVAFLLGLYGTAQLPVTFAGVALLVLAVALIVAETQVPSFGVLGIAGVVALVASAVLLYDTDSEAFSLSVPVAAATGVVLGGFVLFAGSKAMAARSAPARSPAQDLVGVLAVVRSAFDPVGQVYADGALWRARSADPGRRPAAGDRVRVEAVDGLTLTVHPEPEPEEPT